MCRVMDRLLWMEWGCAEKEETGYGMFHMRKDCHAWDEACAEAVRGKDIWQNFIANLINAV